MKRSTRSGERSDQIGELGEIKFKELCSLANLHCSKVEPDKTGKDYIVEFRSQAFSPTISYDKREAPKQIIVQVKTISAKNKRVKIAASVAERLAKDLRPAIICILTIDDSNRFTAMHFVEIIDQNLEKVLKRLRAEYHKENNKLHKSELSFGPSEAQAVDMDPSALYSKMSSLPSPTMEEYATRKNEQIQTLGYPEYRYSLKFTFDADNVEDIADGLLGLKPLKVLEHTETEHRFDIALRHDGLLPHSEGAILSIESEPDDNGTLVAIDKANGIEFSVSAESRAIPMNFVPNVQRALIRWKNGSIKLSLNDRKIHATVKVVADQELPPSEWHREIQFLSALFGKSCELTFRCLRGELSLGKLIWPSQVSSKNFNEILRCTSVAGSLLEAAGAAEQKLSLKSILESRDQLIILSEVMQKNVRISANLKDSPVSKLLNTTGVFISSVPVGGSWIGFSFPMDVSVNENGSDATWFGAKCGEIHLEMIHGDISANFEQFRVRTMKISNAQCAFVQRPGDFLSEDRTLLEYVDKSEISKQLSAN
jgi:hypothetical protein